MADVSLLEERSAREIKMKKKNGGNVPHGGNKKKSQT